MITVVGNLKGGTGKSTLVFNLALWHLLHSEDDMTIYDLDPQGTVMDSAEVRVEEGYEPALTVVSQLPNRIKGQALIDIGMSDMDAMRSALAVAERVLIPVAPSQADVWSTQRFLEIVAAATKRKRKKPELFAFVSRADTHTGTYENSETRDALKSIKGLTVLKSFLSQRVAFRRSFSEGLGVFELEPNSKAAAELNAMAREIFGKRRSR